MLRTRDILFTTVNRQTPSPFSHHIKPDLKQKKALFISNKERGRGNKVVTQSRHSFAPLNCKISTTKREERPCCAVQCDYSTAQ